MLNPDKPGVRVDACKAFEATVESFTRESPESGWWDVTLKGDPSLYRWHHNAVVDRGPLKPGDEVEGIVNTLDGSTFWLLQKKPRGTESA